MTQGRENAHVRELLPQASGELVRVPCTVSSGRDPLGAAHSRSVPYDMGIIGTYGPSTICEKRLLYLSQ